MAPVQFSLSKAWPGRRWMHCLDRNSSSLLGVRIQSLIRHGSKNRKSRRFVLAKNGTKTTLGASHSQVLSFQTWVMPNQWTVMRYLAKFQAETCGWNRQITSNTHVHQLFHFFPPKKKTSPSLSPHLTHLTCTAAEFGVNVVVFARFSGAGWARRTSSPRIWPTSCAETCRRTSLDVAAVSNYARSEGGNCY